MKELEICLCLTRSAYIARINHFVTLRLHYDKNPLIAPPTFSTSSLQRGQPSKNPIQSNYSQERIMSPHAPKFIIANGLIPRHPEGVRDLALLLDREQDVALYAEYEGGDVREGAQPVCEGGEMGRCVVGRQVGFGVGGCGVGDGGE
jgi:hypothetical protein